MPRVKIQPAEADRLMPISFKSYVKQKKINQVIQAGFHLWAGDRIRTYEEWEIDFDTFMNAPL